MSQRAFAFLCFFFSGTTGLMYEVVWTRLLGNTIGNTHFSITVVVSVFMGGLALGSYAGGRIADRSRNPLRIYGLAVLLVGLSCLLVPLAVTAAKPLFRWLYGFHDGVPEATPLLVARILFSAAALIVPTSFMGATLPALSRHLARGLADLGKTIGRLYAINTLGAVVGTFFTGFAGIRYLGVWGCTAIAVLVDVVIGLVVLRASRAAAGAAPARRPEPGAPSQAPAAAAELPFAVRLALIAFGVSGFANMLLQIAWTKAIVLTIGNSTYAFSVIVTLFILGIALGGGLASTWVDRVRNLPLTLGVIITATAALVSATIPLLGYFPVIASRWFDSIEQPSYGSFLAVHVLLVSVVILPSTTLMGAVFPIVGKIRTLAIESVGTAVGAAYFWNTLGSILGTLAAGFVFIPLLGKVYWTLYLGAGISLAMGLTLVLASLGTSRAPRFGSVAAAGLIIAGHAFFLPHGVLGSTTNIWHPSIMSRGAYVYFRGAYYNTKGAVIPRQEFVDGIVKENKILFYEEGIHAPVAVVQNTKGEIAMRIAGKVEASYAPGGAYNTDQPHQILAGHLPMVLHPRPKDVLTLGLGGGVTLGTLTLYPIDSVDSLEISPEVIEAARRHFGDVNHGALDNAKVRNVVGDGRNHLEYTRRSYDVITSVPSNPWIAGIGNLFTVEFFRICRSKLREGGVICNWIHKINMRAEDFRTVVRTFLEVFGDHAQFWDLGYDALLIGGSAPVRFDAARFQDLLRDSSIAHDFAGLGIFGPESLLRHYHMNADDMRRYAGAGPLNTDAFPVLEFSCPYGLYGHSFDAYGSLAFAQHSELPAEWLAGVTAPVEDVKRARAAFHLFQVAESRMEKILEELAPYGGEVDASRLSRDEVRHLAREAFATVDDLEAIERDTRGTDAWLRGQSNLLAAKTLGGKPLASLPATLAAWRIRYAEQAKDAASRLENLDRAAAYAAEDAHAALDVARAYLAAGQPARGAPIVEAALVKWPEDPLLLQGLGVLEGAQGRTAQGLVLLEKALGFAKEAALRSEIHQNLGFTHQTANRPREAIAEYEKALAENPQNAAAKGLLEQVRKKVEGAGG